MLKRLKKSLLLINLRLGRSWPVMLAIALFATGVGYLWWRFDVFSISDDERNAYDNGLKKFTGKAWFPWGNKPRNPDIIIVAIDDKTFNDIAAFEPWREKYGSWPYTREIYADIFEYIHACGAKQIIFDATLDEPKDLIGDQKFAAAIKDNGIPFYFGFNVTPLGVDLPKVEKPVNRLPPAGPPPPQPEVDAGAPEPAGAQEFPEEPAPPPKQAPKDKKEKGKKDKPAAKDKGAKDQKAAKGQPAKDEEFPGGDEQFPGGGDQFPAEGPADAGAAPDAGAQESPAAAALKLAAAEAFAFPVEVRGGLELPTFPTAEVFDAKGQSTGEQVQLKPVPSLRELLPVASGIGVVLPEEDEDGKMRRTHFVYTDGKNTYLTIGLAPVVDALKADKIIIEPGKLTIGTKEVKIDRDGAAWIDYDGTLFSHYKTISMVDVLRLQAAKQGQELFKDKYVFLAGVALGTGDTKATPLASSTPGVAKQVAVFENLMGSGFNTDAPDWASLLLSFLTCFASVALVMVIRNTFVDIGWPLVLYTGFFLFTGSLLSITNVHVLTAMPAFAGTIASVLATAWERLFASQERERIKAMFSSYMEADLVEHMVEQRELPKLEGENLRVTAYFSDIQGFTAISEQLEAKPLVLMGLLNRYLSTVTPILTGQGACIDKYIGDAVVALFGAPVSHEDHALRACRGALAVQKANAELREALAKEGLPLIYTRIGINTDTMLVGNIGSEQLLDYTALGDGMNLASRLEGTNKTYGTFILIGEHTYQDAKAHLVAREVDNVRVQGKAHTVRMYELVGLKGEVPAAKLDLIALYEQALAQYRQRNFAEALKLLEKAHGLDQNDGPTRVLGARCARFVKQPPPPEWDGVTEVEK